MTAIEYLTGWPVAKALLDARAETIIARFLHDEIAMIYGPFQVLLSDNGNTLVGQISRSCSVRGIELQYLTIRVLMRLLRASLARQKQVSVHLGA